ncbi:MAG: helix-turn-helix domain-containing protein [Rhodobacteraceae bacterium]|nr:helix-turn-helix domain-containing protein [Paracoccaceae bacterium]
MILRKLRLDRGWSQEQLAEISGVSTRTIQRIERGRNASLESLKCLAAVFETDFITLREDTEMPDQNLTIKDRDALDKLQILMAGQEGRFSDAGLSEGESEAMEYVRDIKGFYAHLASYVLVMILLLVLNLVTGGSFWVVWPALGWGIGVFFHGISVFETFSPFSVDWEKRQIEKRLRRK